MAQKKKEDVLSIYNYATTTTPSPGKQSVEIRAHYLDYRGLSPTPPTESPASWSVPCDDDSPLSLHCSLTNPAKHSTSFPSIERLNTSSRKNEIIKEKKEMALLYRIKQAKLNPFSRNFKRCYFQIAVPSLPDHQPSKGIADYCHSYMIKPKYISRNPLPAAVFGNNVRFFAAPAQFQKVEVKEKEKESKKHRLNEHIKVEVVRLIINEEEHLVLPTREALRRAKELELDLVEVDRSAKPPVCKIMDYHKERYMKQVKEKERAKVKAKGSLKGGACKEVRFSAKTEPKDLKMKADTTRRLLERGYRVKCLLTGTENQDLGGLLSQLSAMIEDVAIVEESKETYIIFRHVKFGPAKKGYKNNKASNILCDNSSETPSAATAADLDEASSENDMDNDDKNLSDLKHDFEKMFDMQMNSNMVVTPRAANDKAAGFSQSRLPNFRAPNVESSFQETENRYARHTKNNASAANNSSESPNYRSHPQPSFDSHSSSPPRLARNESFASRNFQPPQNETRQSGAENKHFEPRGNFSASANNAGSRDSQSTGFGARKVDASEKHRSGVEVNQFTGGNSFAKRNSGPCNPDTVKSNGSQGSGIDDSGKWGIFGKENSNSTPRRSFHSY